MPAPLRHAGIYHVATGTWTRGGATASFGPDVIYNATAPSGYFGTGWEGDEGIDEGILPSLSNPKFAAPQDAYRIDGFEFAYCSTGTSVDWSHNFYDSYVPCDIPSSPANCIALNWTRSGNPSAPRLPACSRPLRTCMKP